jgi:PAS domain S-box-containing protein
VSCSLVLGPRGIVIAASAGAPSGAIGRCYSDLLRERLREGFDACEADLGALFRGDKEEVERRCVGQDGAGFGWKVSRLRGWTPVRFLAVHDPAREDFDLRRALFALDQASRAVFWVEPGTGRFEYANEAAGRMFGYAREEFRRLRVSDLDARVKPEDWPAIVERARTRPLRVESEGRHASGRTFPILVEVSRLVLEGQEYFCTFIRDLTETKALEEQFLQAQKLEAVGRLAGGVAHDFNNLLVIINGYSELLLTRGSLSESDRALVHEVSEAGRRAAGMTGRLLAFSRRQLNQPVVLDLNQLLVDMEKMLRRLIGEDIQIELRKETGLGRVRADPGQLEQVVMNLAVNARDAMPRGGRITLETANAAPEELRALGLEVVDTPYVRLKVSDSGCGMDAATLARLYEPFFTTKEAGKGTGLGLSTVYGIVKGAGGHIRCVSKPGVGTTFTIFLPRLAAPAASVPAPSSDAPRSGHERVLLVEDDPCVRLTMRTLLEKYGYRVKQAESAEDVVKNPGEAPDLVLSDWVMPGMDGPSFARWVRQVWPGVPIVLASGYSEQEVRSSAAAVADGFLQKPFTSAVLARKVRDALDLRRAGTPA